MKKLLIVDALNLIKPAYEVINAPDSIEKAEQACSVVSQSFAKSLKIHKPTHCLWIFDGPGATIRHAIYPDYKKDSTPLPIGLAMELEDYKVRLARNGVKSLTRAGIEADDLIKAVSLKAIAHEFEVVVMSNDKDLAWLFSIGAKPWSYQSKTFHDDEWCLAKHGVTCAQMLDYLALCGDSADNIPGVPLVGVKTAATLLNKFGTLAHVLAAAQLGEIEGKVGKTIAANVDQAILSRKLTELRESVIVPEAIKLDSYKLPIA